MLSNNRVLVLHCSRTIKSSSLPLVLGNVLSSLSSRGNGNWFKYMMNKSNVVGRNFSSLHSLLRNEVTPPPSSSPSLEQKPAASKTAFESKQDKRMRELEERLLKGKAGVLITNKREKEIVVSGVILTFALFFVSLIFTFYRVYDTYLQKQIRFLPSPFVKLEENQIDCIDFFGHHYYHMPKQTFSIEEIEELEKKSIR